VNQNATNSPGSTKKFLLRLYPGSHIKVDEDKENIQEKQQRRHKIGSGMKR
jgi:hypothetical protein